MSIRAAGQVRKLSISNRNWTFPSDIDVTFWPGGRHNAEWLEDNQGGTASQRNTTGKIIGIPIRNSKVNDLGDLVDVIKATTENPVNCLVELANGEKWSAPIAIIIDEGGIYTSAEARSTIDAYAANDTGEFVQV